MTLSLIDRAAVLKWLETTDGTEVSGIIFRSSPRDDEELIVSVAEGPEPFPAELSAEEQSALEQLIAGLDEVDVGLDKLIAQMTQNISLLRDATLEVKTAAAILRNSNEFSLARAQETQSL